MRILLDTHVWLWWLADPDRLDRAMLDLLRDGETAIHLSVASVWEAVMKQSLGKLDLGSLPEDFALQAIREDSLVTVPIRADHAVRAGRLPLHHRDPFDRMLIAQAQLESLPIVTADPRFEAYDVRVLRAGRD